MSKKILFSVIFSGLFIVTGLAGAATNCDSQPKPALDCPSGYSMMCIPVGGDHWGCGKESNGLILEVAGHLSSSGTKASAQTEVQVQAQGSTESKGSVEVNTERLLPTVNKKTISAKVQVRGWDADKKAAIEDKVQAALDENPEITSAEVTETNVVVHYNAPAKLFGFLPITMNMTVSADADARVMVKFPWYRFLVSTYFSNTGEVVSEVFQHNQIDLEFLKSKAPEDRQVEIFIKISATLKAMHEMSKSIIQNIKA